MKTVKYNKGQVIFVTSTSNQWWHFESDKDACEKAIYIAKNTPTICKVKRCIAKENGDLSNDAEIGYANSWGAEIVYEGSVAFYAGKMV